MPQRIGKVLDDSCARFKANGSVCLTVRLPVSVLAKHMNNDLAVDPFLQGAFAKFISDDVAS